MRLGDVLSERSDLIEIARASETAVGRAYRRVLEEKMVEVTKAMRKRPKINSTDIKGDVRYHFGVLDTIEFLLDLEQEALKEISKPKKGEGDRQ